MSFIVQGPHPLLQSTVVMPSPKVSNSEKLTASVQTLRSINGTVYTYVKHKRGRKTMNWDFLVSVDKAEECKNLVRRYAGSAFKITDHNGDTHLGYITVNPAEFTGNSSTAMDFSITFEELV